MNNLGGIALAMLGRGDEAMREFGLARTGAPGSPTVWKNTAVLLWGLGRREEAMEAAGRAVRLDPRLADLLAPLTGARGSGVR
jgi:Flp pilus assembly protein TadD